MENPAHAIGTGDLDPTCLVGIKKEESVLGIFDLPFCTKTLNFHEPKLDGLLH